MYHPSSVYTLGSMTLPLSSAYFKILKAARIIAISMDTEEFATLIPGQARRPNPKAIG